MRPIRYKLVRQLLATSMLAGAVVSNSAAAQVANQVDTTTATQAPSAPPAVANQETPAADQASQDIVVTGTLIRGIAPTGTNVVGLTRADIVATGAVDTNQVLARIPQITSAFNQTPAVPNSGPSGVVVRPNLRNLSAAGGTTTLVLLDGHRLVDVGIIQTSPDPNVIPPALLEKVDVVLDGGSSIYGSDAVGGVINFITRRRFDGLQTNVRYGFADNYHSVDANVIAGKDWGSGSAYISYTYTEHDAIFGRDRDYVRQISPNSGYCSPGSVSITRDGTTTQYGLPGRTAGVIPTCDFTDNLTIYPAERRHSVFAGLSQDLSDSITFDFRGFYTHQTTRNNVDFNQVGGFSSLGQTGTITPSNPYYVPIAPDVGSQTVNFSYAGIFDSRRTVTLDEYGITPSFTAQLGHGWQLRALGNYGYSDTVAHAPAIDATAQSAALAGTTTATALNPYNLSATNPAVLNSIYRDDYGRGRQELINGRLVLDGSLITLPGGDVKVAGGVEFIRQELRAAADQIVPGTESTATRATADRNVKSVFGEVVVPIVGSGNAMTGIQTLTLSGSARYDHYSDFGSTTNPKVGVTYKPVNWFTVRGNWGTSFNAPSLADAAGAVDTRIITLPVSPFREVGSPFFPDFLRPTIVLAGGNPNLKPQKARTFSVGGEAKVPFVEGLTLSATYYNIHLRDQIASIPFFSPAAFIPAYSAFVIRNPTLAQAQAAAAGITRLQGATSLASLYGGPFGGPYVLLDARRQNLGRTRQDGIDFNSSYVRQTSFGSISAGVGGTYTLKRNIEAVRGGGFVDDLDSPGNSRFNLVGTAGATFHALTGLVTVSHTGGYGLNPVLGTQSHVSSFTTVDLFFSYSLPPIGLMKDVALTLNVNNVFDQDPPFYNQDNGYTNGSTLGRFFQFGFQKKF